MLKRHPNQPHPTTSFQTGHSHEFFQQSVFDAILFSLAFLTKKRRIFEISKKQNHMSLDLIEEGKFRYVKAGEGKPLVLLHGLFGALSNFQDVIDGFSNEYQVVIPMLPIYELPLLKTNVKNISRFLEDFIEHMGFDKVILLGNSLGGHVGLVYSDSNPHQSGQAYTDCKFWTL